MPALGWLLNLGFAGGPVEDAPASSVCLNASYKSPSSLDASDTGSTSLNSKYSGSTQLTSKWNDCNG